MQHSTLAVSNPELASEKSCWQDSLWPDAKELTNDPTKMERYVNYNSTTEVGALVINIDMPQEQWKPLEPHFHWNQWGSVADGTTR
jgi:hypothetical protein